MVSYRTEVMLVPGATSTQSIAQRVQVRVEAFAAEGWRLAAMAGLGATGGFFFGSGTNPSLVLVFEHP